MARVIDRYAATAGGSSTMYYYRAADNTSAATRIYTGTGIYLAADYGQRITNQMYPMVDPKGWIHWYHVRDITPVYRTVTDACTAPTALALDTAAKTLTITGGGGGDLNAWTGFGVSWRERKISESTWGDWSADSVTSSRTVSVSVDSGMVRQFRVRTMGEAGSAYYSGYTVCATLLNGNTAAGTPVILLPLSGTETCASVPMIKLECPAEPDGDDMILQRKLDSDIWISVAILPGSGGMVYDALPADPGEHTLRYRLTDVNGETGGEDSVTFTCTDYTWLRSIQPGDVIANREISFVRDIGELLERVNVLRAFYGLSAISLPGTPGRIADWQSQLVALQTAVNEARAACGRGHYGFASASAWPAAGEIQQLRQAIETT